jgi:hypothetical protein
MKRSDLLAAVAALLPIGAVAVVRAPEPEPNAILHVATEPGRDSYWRVVHPSRDGRLLSYHELEAPCRICRESGVPAGLL